MFLPNFLEYMTRTDSQGDFSQTCLELPFPFVSLGPYVFILLGKLSILVNLSFRAVAIGSD